MPTYNTFMDAMDWAKIRHFKVTENWGDPYKMESSLVYTLDEFRSKLNSSIFITCGTQGKHKANSEHYIGKAVDCVLPHYKRDSNSVIDLIFTVLRYPFMGVGFYPDWKYNGEKSLGFHLDVRATSAKAQWMGVELDGKQQYLGLTSQNIIKYL